MNTATPGAKKPALRTTIQTAIVVFILAIMTMPASAHGPLPGHDYACHLTALPGSDSTCNEEGGNSAEHALPSTPRAILLSNPDEKYEFHNDGVISARVTVHMAGVVDFDECVAPQSSSNPWTPAFLSTGQSGSYVWYAGCGSNAEVVKDWLICQQSPPHLPSC